MLFAFENNRSWRTAKEKSANVGRTPFLARFPLIVADAARSGALLFRMTAKEKRPAPKGEPLLHAMK